MKKPIYIKVLIVLTIICSLVGYAYVSFQTSKNREQLENSQYVFSVDDGWFDEEGNII